MQIKEPILACPVMQDSVPHTDANILLALEKCFEKIGVPRLATVKMDGIRALRLNGSLLSRKFITIPNKKIVERSLILPGGVDVELWSPHLTFQQITSIVMSQEHPDWEKVQYHILDWVQEVSYEQRMCNCDRLYNDLKYLSGFQFTMPLFCKTPQSLLDFFLKCEAEEGEGICFRLPNGKYKQGRSTFNEQLLMKLSRYIYEEAIITGVFEQTENTNSATTSKTGHTKRSFAKDGMVGKGTLGGFTAISCKDGKEVRIGSGEGWTNSFRRTVWDARSSWVGKRITFKHKPVGRLNKVRHPIMVGERKEGF